MVGPEAYVNINVITPEGQITGENPMPSNINAIGTKSDVAVTDYTQPGTLIALLKGMTTKFATMKTLTTP